MHFVKGLQDVHNIMAKVYEKDAQTLSDVTKLVEKLNMVKQVTDSVITVTDLVFLPRTTQRKYLHQEHLVTTTDHTPDYIMTATTGTDHSPFITDAARENASTIQGTLHQSQCSRSSSNYQMHASSSLSHHHSSSQYPPTDRLSR